MSEEETRVIGSEELEKLRAQIIEYYDAYFSELRRLLAESELFSEAVPGFLKGHKRVFTVLGWDGVVVAHYPAEKIIIISDRNGTVMDRFPAEPDTIREDAARDSYEFMIDTDASARDIVIALSGGEDVDIGISPGVPWGAKGFNMPQQKVDPTTGELAWQAPWTRLVCADLNTLYFWEDTERAKREAKEDLEPYVYAPDPRAATYKELDEIRAPEDIEAAGIKAGDRGVVLEVFERPTPALLVEYADEEGQTKALVTYSTDLKRTFGVFPERDRETGGRLPVIERPSVDRPARGWVLATTS